jgi:anti-anti-sigma factor
LTIDTSLLPGSATLAVTGDIDGAILAPLRGAIDQVVEYGAARVVLDLSKVTYIDSMGVCALYQLTERAGDHRTIDVIGLSPSIRRILHISGFGRQDGVRLAPGDDPAGQLEQPQKIAAVTRPRSWARTFASDLAQLERVREFVQEVADDSGLEADRTFALKVSVSEAAANAIEHGGSGDDFEIRAKRNAARLSVAVSHPGAFIARTGDDPSRGHRGMGLPLMLGLVDEVTVSRPRRGGTRVTLSLFL